MALDGVDDIALRVVRAVRLRAYLYKELLQVEMLLRRVEQDKIRLYLSHREAQLLNEALDDMASQEIRRVVDPIHGRSRALVLYLMLREKDYRGDGLAPYPALVLLG